MPQATERRNGHEAGAEGARRTEPPKGPGSPDPRSRAALEAILSEAAAGATGRRLPARSALRLAGALASRPQIPVRRAAGLARELARVTVGRSKAEPPKGDRRFKDPAWAGNPVFRRLLQAYLVSGQTLDDLISDADLDWRSERRLRFAAENLVDALAPSNFPLLNPAVLKAVLDTGGGNFLKGARQFAQDMARPPRVPSMVDESAFKVGENLALSPGAVVLRRPMFELIQYEPSTDRVRAKPLLLVPPMINKFYVADLAPGRSMIEHFVASGQQVLTISWRNPGEEQADWGFEAYVAALLEALDATEAISGEEGTHLLALCAGGMVAAAAVAHLAAQGHQDRIAGLALGVCVLDNERAGTAGALLDRSTAAAAMAESARRGYLSGRALAGVFAWLRPNDLVWNYWINNYLLGKDPPPFDVLFWNADTTNMPAALHHDFIELALENKLARPGGLKLLGTPIDLRKVTADSYVVAGIADHISPWKSAYRTTALLGSEPRFVLSTSGHIAAMVNPPGNEKSSFQVAEGNPADPDEWLEGASERRGTWWEDWTAWLAARSGPERAAPERLGGAGYEPLEPAPGTYVHQSA